MRTLLFFIILFSYNSYSQNTTPITIGESFSVKSLSLDEERNLNIYLPFGYSNDSAKTYPVIYLLDGGIDQDFLHISGINQFLSYSWINQMPEAIVVGITNTDRKQDFTYPTTIEQDKIDFPTTGGSAKFIEFLTNELPKKINERYKTNTTKVLIGQSLGGLLATEILLSKPQSFSHYIVVSPSLWWDNQSLLEKVTPKALSQVKRIFISVGREGRVMQRDAKQLYKKLNKSVVSKNIAFHFFKEQDHGDVLHLAAYAGFIHSFKP